MRIFKFFRKEKLTSFVNQIPFNRVHIFLCGRTGIRDTKRRHKYSATSFRSNGISIGVTRRVIHTRLPFTKLTNGSLARLGNSSRKSFNHDSI